MSHTETGATQRIETRTEQRYDVYERLAATDRNRDQGEQTRTQNTNTQQCRRHLEVAEEVHSKDVRARPGELIALVHLGTDPLQSEGADNGAEVEDGTPVPEKTQLQR